MNNFNLAGREVRLFFFVNAARINIRLRQIKVGMVAERPGTMGGGGGGGGGSSSYPGRQDPSGLDDGTGAS